MAPGPARERAARPAPPRSRRCGGRRGADRAREARAGASARARCPARRRRRGALVEAALAEAARERPRAGGLVAHLDALAPRVLALAANPRRGTEARGRDAEEADRGHAVEPSRRRGVTPTLPRPANRDAHAALSGLARRERLRGRLVQDELGLQRAALPRQVLTQLFWHTVRLALQVAHPATHPLDLRL